MNESIIVYLAFIAIIIYFNLVPDKKSIEEFFTGKANGYDYRDFLCKTRKPNCDSVVNLNERSLSMSPGNLRDKVFYDF
jgi:hypothetical protein